MGSTVPLPGAIAEVFITDELFRRTSSAPDYLREKLAIQDLASHMADRPTQVVPRLVQLALEICEADSAGVSILEGPVFRWFGLKGKLSVFEGATTPRDFSPCGVCLDYGSPILMERPERVYGWIADAKITVPEVLLVPLTVEGSELLGTLWVVAKEGQHFDGEHARVVSELATFAGVALRMIQSDEKLKKTLVQQETLAREMSHRVKNLFAVFDGMIRMSARAAETKEELAESLSGRLSALAAANGLVRRSFGSQEDTKEVELAQVIGTILRPYGEPRIDGPPVTVGDRSTNDVALVFHELATNAAKYGSFSTQSGSVTVRWHNDEGTLVIDWTESNGPQVARSSKKGFGSTLVDATIASHGGTIERNWSSSGLSVVIRMPLGSLAR